MSIYSQTNVYRVEGGKLGGPVTCSPGRLNEFEVAAEPGGPADAFLSWLVWAGAGVPAGDTISLLVQDSFDQTRPAVVAASATKEGAESLLKFLPDCEVVGVPLYRDAADYLAKHRDELRQQALARLSELDRLVLGLSRDGTASV